MLVVQLAEHRGRVGEHTRIELERAVRRVPPRRHEASAEIDECIAGQTLLAEGARDGHDHVATGKGATRLLVAERPEWRHLRESREPCILAHHLGRFTRGDDEDVEGKRRAGIGCGARAVVVCFRAIRVAWRARGETSLVAGEIERAVWLVDEHRPPRGPDEPGDGYTAAVRAQLVSALTAPHAIGGATAVELWPALAES